MKLVRLKNGTEEADVAVGAVMISLRSLFADDPITGYELAMKCRDRTHKLFGNTGDKLTALALIGSDARVHDTIRNIVLSAVEGDGLDMTLGSPLAS